MFFSDLASGLKDRLKATFSAAKGMLVKSQSGLRRMFLNYTFMRALRVIFVLSLILWVGPFVYVFGGIPQLMRPVNYYDFLNTCLLLYLLYRIEKNTWC